MQVYKIKYQSKGNNWLIRWAEYPDKCQKSTFLQPKIRTEYKKLIQININETQGFMS